MKPFLALFDLVGVLARRRHQLADTEFAALGLSHTEARLLSLLHESDGFAAQDSLTQKITVDRTQAGRAIQRLEQHGFLQRSQHPTDKRAKLVSLTEKGQGAVIEIRKLRAQMAATFFGNLTEREAQEIVDVLARALDLRDSGLRATREDGSDA